MRIKSWICKNTICTGFQNNGQFIFRLTLGEANAGSPASYLCTFPTMIDDWRQKFHTANSQNDPLFPFGFVQVRACNFKGVGEGAAGARVPARSKVGAQVDVCPNTHFWTDEMFLFRYLLVFCSKTF